VLGRIKTSDRSCETWSITQSQVGEKYPTNDKKKGRLTGLVTSCVLPSETRYSRKDTEKDRSDRKTQRRRKQLLDDLKETRGYWKLYEEALDRNVCVSRFGKDYGPVIRQDCRMNKYTIYKCGRGSHNTTWGAWVGYPCFTRTAWL